MGDLYSVFSGGAGSLLSAVGSVWSTKQQKKENQKNRDFQAKQAELSRQYNTQMVNSQNRYNSPSETVKRLLDAGINPALAYNNGASLGSVGVGSTSQMASGSGGVNPPGIDFSGITNAANMSAEYARTIAQKGLLESQKGLSDKQLFYYDESQKKEFLIQDSVFWKNYQEGSKSFSERRSISLTCDNIAETLNLIKEQVKSTSYDNMIKFIDLSYHDETVRTALSEARKRIEESDSRIKVNNATVWNIYKLFTINEMLANDTVKLNDYQRGYLFSRRAQIWNYIKNESPAVRRNLWLDVDNKMEQKIILQSDSFWSPIGGFMRAIGGAFLPVLNH